MGGLAEARLDRLVPDADEQYPSIGRRDVNVKHFRIAIDFVKAFAARVRPPSGAQREKLA